MSAASLHNHAILLVLARSLPRDLTVFACCRRPAMTVPALPTSPGCTRLRRLCSSSTLVLAAARWRRGFGRGLLLLLLLLQLLLLTCRTLRTVCTFLLLRGSRRDVRFLGAGAANCEELSSTFDISSTCDGSGLKHLPMLLHLTSSSSKLAGRCSAGWDEAHNPTTASAPPASAAPAPGPCRDPGRRPTRGQSPPRRWTCPRTA